MSGRFFSFDGLDGVGKSTQSKLFGEWLRDRGDDVLFCRDPGSTPLGEVVRKILLDRNGVPFGRRAEMFLYMAARAQLVDEVIVPALAEGKTVVSDRYLLANVVYQGHAGGLEVDALWHVGAVAVNGVRPDLTFVLDMPVERANRRLKRELDRMESQGDEFRSRLRTGFLAEAARRPEIVVIDADRPINVIQAEIRERAAKVVPT